MNPNTEAESSRIPDLVKWIEVVALVVAAIAGFYYFSDYPLFLRVTGLLLIAVVVGYIAVQTEKGNTAWSLIRESRTEVRKVIWPTRKETVQTTLLVIAMVAVVALLMWMFDTVLAWAVRLLLGQGG